MYFLAAILVGFGGTCGLAIGLMHIGFALTDPAPRNAWDWYVVAMGVGMLAMTFPAVLYLGKLSAEYG